MRTMIDIDHPEFHPACDLFPRLANEALDALAEDIKLNGLLEPIVVLNSSVLDGRNRLDACKLAGIEPTFVEWTGKGSPTQWIIGKNLNRRHLTASQRAVVGYRLMPLLEREAKDRQRLSKGRGRKGAQQCETILGKSSEQAASLANSAARTIEQVKAVDTKAPELLDEIINGTINVSEAHRIAQLPAAKREEVIHKAKNPKAHIGRLVRQAELDQYEEQRRASQSPVPVATAGSVTIWQGDCLDIMRTTMEPKSVDVVVTSVPYNIGVNYHTYKDVRDDEEYLAWLENVFEAIGKVLKDNGSFFLNLGVTAKKPWTAHLVAEVAGRTFVKQNEIVWVKSATVNGKSFGHFRPNQSDKYVTCTHEYVFHFTKSGNVRLDRLAIGVPYADKQNMYRNRAHADTRCGGTVWCIPHRTTNSRRGSWSHPCPFPVELPERCIRLHGINDDLMAVDPFNGVGSSTVAMARCGVKGIGIDIDRDYCATAHERLIAEYKVQPHRAELAAILQDTIELDSKATQQQIKRWWLQATGQDESEFDPTVLALPPDLRRDYQRLPSDAA